MNLGDQPLSGRSQLTPNMLCQIVRCSPGGNRLNVESSRYDGSSSIREVGVRMRVGPVGKPGGVWNGLSAAISHVVAALNLLVDACPQLHEFT